MNNETNQTDTYLTAPAEEMERHLAESFRRYAARLTSVINLLENGQHVAAWKNAQGIRDGMAYYMNALDRRIEHRETQSNEDNRD